MKPPRTKAATEKAIARIMEHTEKQIVALADHVRTTRVVPACRRIGGSFSSGMGAYSFYDRHGFPIMQWEARPFDLLAIYETLGLEVYGGQDLGTWVSDVAREEP